MSNIWKNTGIGKFVPLKKSGIKPSRFNRISKKTKIGKDTLKGDKVFFTAKQRTNHTHILGSTGTGKSKLLEYLIRQDIENNNCGLCLIDPHGSLYDEIVHYVSHRKPHLAKRFILFNPAKDIDYILGFNPIEKGADINFQTQELKKSCLKAWGQNNPDDTPRISRVLNNIFYPIIANNLTMVETALFLDMYNQEGKDVLLSRINNDVIKNDWMYFQKSNIREKVNELEGASNRLRKFLGSDKIRLSMGQSENTIDFPAIFDEGKILLVNLNGAGIIDSENTRLLGVMLINELVKYAKRRNPLDKSLKPFYCYIDEFAQFITNDIASSLEETRKYKLFMILAHQHLKQLENENENLYSSVMTNCKNKVVFGGLSVHDSKVMSEQLNIGHLDLKTVKQEMYRTRLSPREETRESYTESGSRTEGESEGKNSSETRTNSESFSKFKSDSRGMSSSNSSSTNDGYSTSQGMNSGHTTGYSYEGGHSYGIPYQNNSSYSDSRNSSSSNNHSKGESYTDSSTESSSEGVTKGTNSSLGKTEGESSSTQFSRTKGWSKTTSPFMNQIEVQELASRTYFSINELLYMKQGELKTQGLAEAVVQIENNPPILTKIDFVESVQYSHRLSPDKITRFQNAVIENNPALYTQTEDARRNYQTRQENIFGEKLNFDELCSEQNIEPQIELDEEDSSFE